MSVDQIRELLERAAKTLREKQLNFFEFTSETNQTEWNIAHHYAIEVQSLFPGYDCDLDIAKPNLGNRRPDIVIHERGTHGSNFLVIEVKRNRSDIPEDLRKIEEFWFRSPLHYQFGSVVVISERELVVEVIRNPGRTIASP